MLIAATRAVSPSLVNCELTHLDRAPIDVDLARTQHQAYEQKLSNAGCTILRVEPAPELADAVFIEDAAIVFDEVAVITRPGATSRRAETGAVADSLRAYRPLRAIAPHATIDGGDVLVVRRDIFIGVSGRTNAAAVEQMREILGPRGYSIYAVQVTGCLHLKSAVTACADDRLLINSAWVSPDVFRSYDLLEIDPLEPAAANIVRAGAHLIYPAAFPRTRERLERAGCAVEVVDVSELQKAEGAVTCCSLIFNSGQ